MEHVSRRSLNVELHSGVVVEEQFGFGGVQITLSCSIESQIAAKFHSHQAGFLHVFDEVFLRGGVMPSQLGGMTLISSFDQLDNLIKGLVPDFREFLIKVLFERSSPVVGPSLLLLELLVLFIEIFLGLGVNPES